MNGSSIALVPRDQRHANNSIVVAEGKIPDKDGRSNEDVELGVPHHAINVIRDVEISRTQT